MHVHAHHGEQVARRSGDVVFNPTPGIHILCQSRQAVTSGGHVQIGEQCDAGASLHPAYLVGAVQTILTVDGSRCGVFEGEFVEDGVDFGLWCTHFLHAPHIRRMLCCPGFDAFALGRADTVDIRGGDSDAHSDQRNRNTGEHTKRKAASPGKRPSVAESFAIRRPAISPDRAGACRRGWRRADHACTAASGGRTPRRWWHARPACPSASQPLRRRSDGPRPDRG